MPTLLDQALSMTALREAWEKVQSEESPGSNSRSQVLPHAFQASTLVSDGEVPPCL